MTSDLIHDTIRDVVANIVADGELADDGEGRNYFTCDPALISALCHLVDLGDLHAARAFVESGGFDRSEIDEANDWFRLKKRFCPDGGACHHECHPYGGCWRTRTCLPLTCSVSREAS